MQAEAEQRIERAARGGARRVQRVGSSRPAAGAGPSPSDLSPIARKPSDRAAQPEPERAERRRPAPEPDREALLADLARAEDELEAHRAEEEKLARELTATETG